jgi:hypothetical protein
MQKTFLIISILILSVSSTFAQEGNQVKDFDALMKAFKAGKNINAVIHYGKCDLYMDGEKQEKSMDAIGGMPLDVYEYFAKNAVRNEHAFVTSSQTKLIQNPIGKGYVYNYVKIRIYDNNKVEVIARYLDPKTYKEKMSEKFKGKVNDGTNNEGVFLFME